MIDIGVYGARGIPSTYSGYETFLTVLLPELCRRGHRVTLYCRRGQVPADGNFQGVRLVHLPATRSKQLGTLAHGALAGAAARFAGHRVVLVVNVANAPFCLAARATGQRVVLNTDGQEWLRDKWGAAAKAYFKAAAHLAGRATAALVSDSRTMKCIYLEQFAAGSTVIPYCWTGIDRTERLDVLERLGVQRRRYFLVAARLNPENQVDTLAEAYACGRLDLPLVVLGTANYRSPVAARLHDLSQRDSRIILGGHIEDRAEFGTLTREARAYLHTHTIGGINPSLIEAMGTGARVVAYDNGFNREALGDDGWYFSSFSELTGMLEKIVDEPAAQDAALRRQAERRSKNRFGLSAVADAYESLLDSVAAGSPWAKVEMITGWDDRGNEPA